MGTRKKWTPLLLAAALLLLSSCRSNTTGKTFRMDIAAPIVNFDPQFAAGADALRILANTQEGLLAIAEDGLLQNALAQGYTISADRKTYTFTLRDAHWENAAPITADDFVFAFERIFGENPSPYAQNFLALQNSQAVLAGELPVSALGIHAPDEKTVIFTLEYADPGFLQALALPAATPCNRAFFDSCRGRYGLEQEYTNASGAFMVYAWNNSRSVELRKNEQYHAAQSVLPAGVIFYIGRENPLALFEDGRSDIVLASYRQESQLPHSDAILFERTTWCLLFNQAQPPWDNVLLRRALAGAIDRDALAALLPDGAYASSTSLLPPALTGNIPQFSPPPSAFAPGEARRQLAQAVDILALRQLPVIELLTADHPVLVASAEALRQNWSAHLGLACNVTIVSQEALLLRQQSANYTVVLAPRTALNSAPAALLAPFVSDAANNYTGYASPIYDSLFAQIDTQARVEDTARVLQIVQNNLLSDAVAIPLYTETECYFLAKGVTGISADPFGERILFRYAQKDD
jgi:ABC-type oligopeptide transport system, periplasmic component